METARNLGLVEFGEVEKRISERFNAVPGAMVITGDGDELTLITAERDPVENNQSCSARQNAQTYVDCSSQNSDWWV